MRLSLEVSQRDVWENFGRSGRYRKTEKVERGRGRRTGQLGHLLVTRMKGFDRLPNHWRSASARARGLSGVWPCWRSSPEEAHRPSVPICDRRELALSSPHLTDRLSSLPAPSLLTQNRCIASPSSQPRNTTGRTTSVTIPPRSRSISPRSIRGRTPCRTCSGSCPSMATRQKKRVRRRRKR